MTIEEDGFPIRASNGKVYYVKIDDDVYPIEEKENWVKEYIPIWHLCT